MLLKVFPQGWVQLPENFLKSENIHVGNLVEISVGRTDPPYDRFQFFPDRKAISAPVFRTVRAV